MAIDAGNLRVDYQADELLEGQVAADPFQQFDAWFKAAQESACPEPNAMIVASLTEKGHPAARVVLLKEVNDRGFIFYTNYASRKGRELTAHPHAAAVFNWLELERQVRIEGRVERLDPEASTEYFQRRPRKSQVGAWASPQSQVIPDREFLEARKEEVEEKFAGREELPRPDDWGGFLIIPEMVEFWQGRSSRLHDRLVYRRHVGPWTIDRLAP